MARRYLERQIGPLETQEKSPARVVAELAQGKDFSVTMTQQKFTDALQSTPAAKELWSSRKRSLKMEDIRRC